MEGRNYTFIRVNNAVLVRDTAQCIVINCTDSLYHIYNESVFTEKGSIGILCPDLDSDN